MSFGESQHKKLSLTDVIEKYESDQRLIKYKESLQEYSEAQIASSTRRASEPFAIDIEGETSTSGEEEKRFSAKLQRTWNFGISDEKVRDKFSFEREAEDLAYKVELLEAETQIADLYSDLKYWQMKALALEKSRGRLEPMVKRAKNIASRGGVGGLNLRRWELLIGGIESELAEALRIFKQVSKSLGLLIGETIPEEPTSVLLSEVPAIKNQAEIADHFSIKEIMSRQRALAATAEIARNSYEIEGGIGVYRDLVNRASGVTVELSMPIGVSYSRSSEVAEINSEIAVLSAKSDLLNKKIGQQYQVLNLNLATSRERVEVISKRVGDLENLYDETHKAVTQGQAEPAETIEVLGELNQAQLEKVEAEYNLDKVMIEIHAFNGWSR
jgi:outer membrane protein TolC